MPDQKLKFSDGREKKIAAGATACELNAFLLYEKVMFYFKLIPVFSGARAFELLSPEE
jgi:hypothetical protein